MSVSVLTLLLIVLVIVLAVYFRFSKVFKKTRVQKKSSYLRTGRGYIKRRLGLLGDEIDNDNISKKIKDTGLETNEK